MSDIALRLTSGVADFAIDGNDLAVDDGLQTAVMLSLFTDRRALDTDPLPGNSMDRRGWWGDAFPVVPGDQIGSRLWLLQRSKQSPEVLTRAKGYTLEALQWLLDDKVASAVDVETSFTAPGVLGIAVTITRPADRSQAFQFAYTWAAQAAKVTS